ncbi:NUDIX family hydrolase [Phyllosticta citribraziliensis]|uniref:NUDIX family hydrolase n=1 Tax=Phyllosticta citribraziliensis TaxID=989973 RepID=A0ABR1L6H3_9PEZI
MLPRLHHLTRHLLAPRSALRISTMSHTFTLPNSTPPCPVQLPPDLSQDALLNFPAFKNWIATLQRSLSLQQRDEQHTFHAAPYALRRIDVQTCDWFGGGEGKKLGFVKLKAVVSTDAGEALPGSVFLRGGSVGMLLILQPDDVPADAETDKHVILTVQPRIPAGSLAFAELPAGMLDDSGTFAGGAAKEIHEETGLRVADDQLTDLTALALSDVPVCPATTTSSSSSSTDAADEKLTPAMYPSAGGCDEFVPLFLHQRRVRRQELESWQGRLTGLRDQGEKITLKLVRLEELWRWGGRDSKALGAWALYEGLRREGKL